QFTITHDQSVAVDVTPVPIATSWQPPPPQVPTHTLQPGESLDVVISVTVPADAPIGSQDDGLLAVIFSNREQQFDLASFVTMAGTLADSGEPAKLVWESRTGAAWSGLTVQETTSSLT